MKKQGLTHSLAAKTAAFILAAILLLLTIASAAGAVVISGCDMYTRDPDEVKVDLFEEMSYADAWELLHEFLFVSSYQGKSFDPSQFGTGSNLQYEIKDSRGTVVFSNHKGWSGEYELPNSLYIRADEAAELKLPAENADADGDHPYTVTVYLNPSFPTADRYALANRLLDWGYSLRFTIYFIFLACLIGFIACFVFLLCAAGRRYGHEELVSGWGTSIPFDLLLAAVIGIIILSAALCIDAPGMLLFVLIAAAVLLDSALIIALFMNFALRTKLGAWWKNTVIYRMIALCFALLRGIWRFFKKLFRCVYTLLSAIPLVWKTSLAFGAVALIEVIALSICWYETDNYLVFWIIEHLVLLPFVLWLALILRRLQSGGRALAAGDLSYQVSTGFMPGDFREHAENLNSIAGGMTLAVEERLKSERLKTELITNVSHDIKTPLTSIINYSDLISREECDNEKIREYSGVLLRQSERLKKLIEDLVSASKASTGNVDVLLAPCEADVLLTQAAGEYEQRLRDCGLVLVTRQSDAPVRIMADGRHMWRVMDNLMNNICKYAQSGTRVYLSVEAKNGEALISFKNISRYELDISADELMERFVRGDRSRNTEGSGLGLSIARSLTELQGGRLELSVDGDLFKAVLIFPIIGEEGARRRAEAGPTPADVQTSESEGRKQGRVLTDLMDAGADVLKAGADKVRNLLRRQDRGE